MRKVLGIGTNLLLLPSMNRNISVSHEICNLENYGYLRGGLPSELLDSIKEECSKVEERNAIAHMVKKYDQTPSHYVLGDENKESLLNFVHAFIDEYDKAFNNYSGCWRLLNKNVPFSFGEPWINVQEKFQHLPMHTHDGVYTYTCWINLPSESIFDFMYSSTIGIPLLHQIKLTPADEGGILIFPSLLRHYIHPFSDNSKRVSVSGNIILQVPQT